jgi:hypothetical protein
MRVESCMKIIEIEKHALLFSLTHSTIFFIVSFTPRNLLINYPAPAILEIIKKVEKEVNENENH